MTTTPQRFTLDAEQTARSTEAGDVVAVAVLFDGRPIGSLLARRVVEAGMTDEYPPEFVASGLDVRETGGGLLAQSRRSTSIANTMSIRHYGEPTPAEVTDARLNAEGVNDAFGFVRWGAEGTEVPEGMPDGFYEALDGATRRFGRVILDGVLTGQPRS